LQFTSKDWADSFCTNIFFVKNKGKKLPVLN
jgi:hypothetical protein